MDSRDLTIQTMLGGQYWGMAIMLIFQGINVVELIRYLTTFTAEPLVRYLMVFPMFLIHLVQSGFVVVWTYKLLVTWYGNLSGLVRHDYMISSGPIMSGTVMVMVQGYYVRRLWALRQRSVWVLAIYGVLLPAGWILSLIGTISASSAPEFKNFYTIDQGLVERFEAKWKPFRVAQAVVNIVTDLSICLAMLWTLFRARIRVRGDSVTRNVVGRLIRLIMDTMLLPTVVVVGVTTMYLVYGDADGKQRLFSYPQTGINVFSLLHTLLARQSLRNLVDSQADREMSLHLTQDGAGGRQGDVNDRSESRSRLRNTERSVSAEGWDKVEKDGAERDHRRPRPISTSRSLSQYSISREYDDKLGSRSIPTVSYEMDKLRLHSPPNVYQPLEDATLRANAPGLERKPTFLQEVKAIKMQHQLDREGGRRQSWD